MLGGLKLFSRHLLQVRNQRPLPHLVALAEVDESLLQQARLGRRGAQPPKRAGADIKVYTHERKGRRHDCALRKNSEATNFKRPRFRGGMARCEGVDRQMLEFKFWGACESRSFVGEVHTEAVGR